MSQAQSGEGQFTALIVDDNRPLRKLNRLILKSTGLFGRVSEADNGRTAIEEATKAKPDLILLDLLMPVMDGFEALPQLRKSCPDASIIVLSMVVGDELPERVRSLGADAFLDKAVDEKRLALEIQQILGLRKGEGDAEPSGR